MLGAEGHEAALGRLGIEHLVGHASANAGIRLLALDGLDDVVALNVLRIRGEAEASLDGPLPRLLGIELDFSTLAQILPISNY